MSNITFEQLVDSILDGVADDNIETLSAAIKKRRKIQNSRKILFIAPGDTVRFNGTTRPKYLQGIKAKVVRNNKTTITVFVPEDAWGTRKYRGTEVRVPAGLVDKV